MIQNATLFQVFLELLTPQPIYLIGSMIVIALGIWFAKDSTLRTRISTILLSFILFYYFSVLFSGVVGIPTFTEWQRLMHFGKAIFNPNINLIPFVDGVHIDFILNVLCFLPLGFLLPIISRKYNNLKSILLIGLSISFFIELSQLFTLYRESDINDLITNGLGTLLGWLCFKILVKIGLFKPTQDYFLNGMTDSYWLPIIIAMTAFVNTFIS